MTGQSRRLIYGLLPWVSDEAVVMDAEVAARYAAAATASTAAEFRELFYQQSWEEYRASLREDGDEHLPSPDEPFNFGEWLSEASDLSPQEAAWDVAHLRVAEVMDAGSEIAQHIESGGGSPGGNMDAISGPLEALNYLASAVEPDRDGFTLDRDDEAVQAAWPASLYE